MTSYQQPYYNHYHLIRNHTNNIINHPSITHNSHNLSILVHLYHPLLLHPTNQTKPKTKNPKQVFPPIPIPYSQIFTHLYDRKLISLAFVEPLVKPFPKWYNPDVTCVYHNGFARHDTENDTSLKCVK